MSDSTENLEDSIASTGLSTSEPKENTKGQFKLDPSILIALFAVLISTVSAFISLKESNIMKSQQQILAEQQEAAVWPYLDCTKALQYNGNDSIEYTFIVMNKGIGPAIIDSVTYSFNDKPIKGWTLGQALSEEYPSAKISTLSNETLDYKVLAPGDIQRVISIKIETSENSDFTASEILDKFDFHLEFCYCSVYGKCWKVTGLDEIGPSEECVFRENIR